MNDARFAELIERYFERELAGADKAELEATLLADAEARARFWEETEWRALFRQWGAQEGARVEAQRVAQVRSRAVRHVGRPIASPVRSTSRRWAWTLAFAVIAIACVVWQWPRTPKSKAPNVAVVATVEAVSDSSLAVGAKVKAGAFELARGVAQLRFSSGATMVVQAPAQLDLIGANEVALRRGRVLVEAAGGFVVGTPQGRVRDIGTRFGVAVRDAQNAETHVFDGRVEMGGENLGAGEALAVAQKELTRKPADAAVFPAPQHIIAEPLAGGGFDAGASVRMLWFADRTGEWIGDRCEVVGAMLGVRPHAGSGMLRFVRGERGEEGTPDRTHDAEERQIIDLAPFRAALARGARAEVSARFNRVAGSAEDFSVLLVTYRGSMAPSARKWWSERAALELSRSQAPLASDADPATWQLVEANVPVSPEASYLMIVIAAHRGPQRRELGGHFADSISLRLIEPPRAGQTR